MTIRQPLVKFCGMTDRRDVVRAADLGAAAVGFVFWTASPRGVTPARAREMAAVLPAFVVPVGVFVDAPMAEIRQVVEFVGLGAVQLHGREDPASVEALTCRVIKAIGEPGGDLLAEALHWSGDVTLLVDNLDAKRRGGTGTRADWSMARVIAETRRAILAGGLTPDNVGEAIIHVRPYGVDVSSGVEHEHTPGVKDWNRMRRFVEAVELSVTRMPDATGRSL
jgi:phosphoribosylanthranilate isomerase